MLTAPKFGSGTLRGHLINRRLDTNSLEIDAQAPDTGTEDGAASSELFFPRKILHSVYFLHDFSRA